MLSNTKLGVKSKTKNSLIPCGTLYLECCMQFLSPCFKKKKMLHKGKKGNKDDQKLRHCYSI